MVDLSAYEQLLQSHFGHRAFRPGQARVLSALRQGKDALVVLPTGGGKSLCYQLPALLPREKPALCVAVSPLNALMRDQVEALRARGIEGVDYLGSLQSSGEGSAVMTQLLEQKLRLLYVSPERFASSYFREALSRNRVGLFAIDEAHCISQWGHDFRPEYRELARHLDAYPGARRLALTATATPRVADDIVKSLGLRDPERVIESFDRPNLSFEIHPAPPSEKQFVIEALLREIPGSAIVYVGKRGDAEDLATALKKAKFDAAPYHAGLSREVRHARQDEFLSGELRVLCATVAFGMGIDKPDVRLVVHHRLPASIEAYYQEAGRAGRDGEPARCALLYHAQDLQLQEWFLDQACPGLEFHADLHAAIARGESSRDSLARKLEALETKLQVALTGLAKAGLVGPGENGELSAIAAFDPAPLAAHLAQLQHHRSQGGRLLTAVQGLAEGTGCRRAALLRYFGQLTLAKCENCSGCKPVAVPRRALERGEKSCPTCGARMVRRKSDRGSFYGCSEYPRCRGTMPGKGKHRKRATWP